MTHATFPVGSQWVCEGERCVVVVSAPLVIEFDSGAQRVVRAEELFPVVPEVLAKTVHNPQSVVRHS